MARPKKNNLDYYSHDNNMRNDKAIKAVRAKFGHTGYSIYNMLLETLCESDLLIIKWDNVEIELISGDFNIVSEELINITEYLCKVKLLKMVNGYLYCPELDERSEGVFVKRIKLLGDLRSDNGINLTETKVKGKKTPQSKVKESKEYNWKKEKHFEDKELNILFIDYLEIRNKIKAINSKRAITSLINKIRKLTKDKREAIQIIDNSIINSWKSVYPLKNEKSNRTKD